MPRAEKLVLAGRGGPASWGGIASALVLAAALVAALGLWRQADDTALADLRANLTHIAAVTAANVDVELHAALRDEEQTNGAEYAVAVAPLRHTLASVDDLVYAYTLVRDGDAIRFVLDGADPGDNDGDGVEDQSAVWEEYPDVDPVALAVLDGAPAQATARPYTDAWGTFISAYAPVHDSAGRIVGILGVDQCADEFAAAVRRRRASVAFGLLPALALAVAFGLLVARLRRLGIDSRARLSRLADERDAARLRAEDASRTKSEFLANMSHEIRTPLTAVLGCADLVRDELDEIDVGLKVPELLDTIGAAGHHLLQVINDVLDISKVEAGELTLAPEVADLPRALRDVAELSRVRAASQGLQLDVELTTPIPSVAEFDPLRVRQVLVNIVGNATKFTEEGRVTLRVGVDGGRLVVDVEDTGVGIPEGALSSVFEPFVQADGSTSRRFGGTGLGLALSRRLARLHGGDVELVRSVEGEGTLFRISLAIGVDVDTRWVDTLEGPERRRPGGSSPLAEVRGRVLVAEDNPVNQRLVRALLERAGAEVAVADDGLDALDAIDAATRRGEPFDLVVTDLQMPRLDGPELVRRLREAGLSTPIIALTANALDESRAEAIAAGCDDFATKPIVRETFLATCSRALALAQAR